MEAGDVPRTDLSAFGVRQIVAFGDDGLTAELERVWGKIGKSSAGKLERIAALKKQLTPEHLAAANASSGRFMGRTAGTMRRAP